MSSNEVAYRRKTAGARKQELIAAGIFCLGKGGMAGFTIDQICKTAGVSRGLINHHFSTKEELLVRIYSDMTEHLIFEPAQPGAESQLRSIIDISFDEASFNRSNLRAWLSIWGQVPSNKELYKLHRERILYYRTRIKTALLEADKGAEKPFDIDSVARQLIALIDGLWLEYCLDSKGYSLADARTDCYRFLEGYGIHV